MLRISYIDQQISMGKLNTMKKNIRHAVFETNSSSTHAISLAKSPTFDAVIDIINDKVLIQTREFGWEFDRYTDFETKASYLATFIDKYTKAKDSIQFLALFTKVITDYTNAKVSIFNNPNSYIDHQSIHVARHALANYDACKRFLFSSQSVLFTGNDNESTWEDDTEFEQAKVDSYYSNLES